MSIETVAVAGGSGKIGREILDVLDESGYRTVNLDRHPTDDRRADEFVRVDLLDAGQVASAFGQWDADAAVHMATVTSPNHDPGHVTFESNAMSTYNVLEAAQQTGLEAVCLASSVNAHGWTFQDEPPEIDYLPIDESHRVSPRDPYGLGKHVMEVTADGFGRRDSAPRTIASLRYSGACDDEYLAHLAERDLTMADLRERYEPGDNPGFRYLHVRDAALLAVRAVEADFEGHETFWAVAPDSTVDVPTEDLVTEFYPDTELRASLSGTDGLFDVSKAQELLGWEPARSWRDR